MIPTVDELKERYSSYSNDRLLSVLHNKDQYTSEAVEVARAELGQRNITVEDVDGFLRQEEERQTVEKIMACIPLKWWEKALFFFVWFAPWFLGGALRLNYHEDGMLLKGKQSHAYSIAGFVSLILDGIFSVYFNFNSISSVTALILFFTIFVAMENRATYSLSTSYSERSKETVD